MANVWNLLVTAFKHVDEAMALKDIFDLFKGKKKAEGENKEDAGKTEHLPKQKKKETLQGVGSYWAKIEKESLKNLNNALRKMSIDDQDKCEDGLGEFLEELTNGIFPARLEKVAEQVPYKEERKNKHGQPYTVTVWKERVTEKLVEKEGWDPGDIFVDALNNAGDTPEDADLFWKMLIQASPWARLQKRFEAWTDEKRIASRFVCAITFTRRRRTRDRNHFIYRITFGRFGKERKRAETRKQQTARAWKRFGRAVALIFVLGTLVALTAIPVLFFKLTFGSAAADAGISDVLKDVLWDVFALAILSAFAVGFLRLWGVRFPWRKYWATLFFLTAVGLGVRLFAHFFDLSEHPLLSGAAILALAILAWNGVHRRFMWWMEEYVDKEGATHTFRSGRLQKTLNATAGVILVGAIVGMLPSHFDSVTAWALERQDEGRAIAAHLDADVAVSPLTEKVKYCRPIVPKRVWDEEQQKPVTISDVWPFSVPEGFPKEAMRYRCDPKNPGVEPHTLLPGKALTSEDMLLLLQWEAEQKEEGEAKAKIASPAQAAISGKWQLCWDKPYDVEGYRPDMREACFPAQVERMDSAAFVFSMMYKNRGEQQKAVFSWDRVESPTHGTWSQPAPESQGDWYLKEDGGQLLGAVRSPLTGNNWVPMRLERVG